MNGLKFKPFERSPDNPFEVILRGAQGTKWAGGRFRVQLSFPTFFPHASAGEPYVRFRTAIYHPNVDSDGYLCCKALEEKRKPLTATDPETKKRKRQHVRTLTQELRKIKLEEKEKQD